MERFGRGEAQSRTRRSASHRRRRSTTEAKAGWECGLGVLEDDEEGDGGGEDAQEIGRWERSIEEH